MLPLWFIALVSYTSVVTAQLLSEATLFNDNQASTLQCWADVDKYRKLLDIPNGWDLVHACFDSGARMECGYERDDSRAFYANVGYTPPEELNGNVLVPPWNGDISFTNIPWLLLHICSIKCACINGDVTQPIARADQKEPASTVLIRFDDLSTLEGNTPDIITAGDLDHAQHVYGLDLGADPFEPHPFQEHRRYASGNDRFYRPPDDTTSPLRSVRIVGYKKNAPLCTQGNSVQNDVGPDVWDLVSRHIPPDTSLDAQQLCAHQLYGGRSQGNLGATCYRPPAMTNAKRTLVIESILKAPQYTNDFYPPQLYQMSLVIALELYCKASCHCADEDEDNVKARVDQWNNAVKLIKKEGSAQNLAITQDEEIIASVDGSGSGSPDAGGSGTGQAPPTVQGSQSSDEGETGVDAAAAMTAAGAAGCSSNADCCPGCVCIVKLQDSLSRVLAWAGSFVVGCIARKAINPKGRDPNDLKVRRGIDFDAVNMGRSEPRLSPFIV